MASPIHIEIIGLKDLSCSPFPCDNTRSCGLYDCYPTGKLLVAFDALADEIGKEYGGRVVMTLTLIDDEVPPHVKAIIEEHYPPLPIVIVNGRYAPMGRISLPMMQKEIEKCDREVRQ
ncbi:MAG TPA: hypothetical protein PK154_10330 [Methanoregulaceae archaeon]|nr:hypothetical protein [Methanoregulaceae archaeon]HOH80213.1 hypothetical protein [Methanoregulaceae archaeon]HPW11494.1 hypothetical protein [Methanoregulaceae archaeon]